MKKKTNRKGESESTKRCVGRRTERNRKERERERERVWEMERVSSLFHVLVSRGLRERGEGGRFFQLSTLVLGNHCRRMMHFRPLIHFSFRSNASN